MSCNHNNFYAQVKVSRLTETDDSTEVIGYAADIVVNCNECGLPFEFIGFKAGYSPNEPMMSVGATELRLPIRPSTDPVEHAKAIIDQGGTS